MRRTHRSKKHRPELQEFLETGYCTLKRLCSTKPGKLLFLEGLLWKRHAVEIFEIAMKIHPYCSSSVVYLSEDLRGNDADISIERFGRTWTVHDLLVRLNEAYYNVASILKLPLDKQSSQGVQSWENEKNKITDNPESLNLLTYKGQPIGVGILSSYYTFLRSTTFSPLSMIETIKHDYINCSYIYERALIALQSENWTAACIFNGRLKYTWPAVLACEFLRIPILYHERGGTMHHYLFSDHSLSNIDAEAAAMVGLYKAIRDNRRLLEEGNSFFTRKRMGDGISWKSYTIGQKYSKVPTWRSNVPASKGIASFFTSSDDEYLSLRDFRMSDVFFNQIEAARWFVEKCQEADLLPVVRIHPNKAKISQRELECWFRLADEGAIVIEPTDEASSYQLLDESRLVMVTLSTVGLEAVHAGKPLIYLGNTAEAKAGVGYRLSPDDRHCSITELEARARAMIDRDLTSAIGYYHLNLGTRYQWYIPTSLHHGVVGKLFDSTNGSNFVAPWKSKEI